MRRSRIVATAVGWAVVLLCGACASTPQIKTDQPAQVFVMDEGYNKREHKGPAPVPVEMNENLTRYKIEPEEGEPQTLLVLYPEELGGEISLSLVQETLEAEAEKEETQTNGIYYDLLLRAHRRLMAGHFEEAGRLVQRLEREFAEGYATTILEANLAAVEGAPFRAKELFRRAGVLSKLADTAPAISGASGETGDDGGA